MDDLRHDLQLSHSTAVRRNVRKAQPPGRLGRTLAEAREEKRLELRDLSEITNIRLTHLEALEAGRYSDLPEDVYSKNFVRLYAQAVGLDPARMLLLYAQERRRTGSLPTRTGLELPPEPAAVPLLDNPKLGQLLRTLLTALLVVGTVVLALWAFNGLLSPTVPRTAPAVTEQAEATQPESAPPEAMRPEVTSDTSTPHVPTLDAKAPNADARETVAAADAAPVTAPAANPMVLLSLRTIPPGAEISIDGYRFGQSPIIDAPVRAGERTLRVERGGYTPFERTFDLSGNRHLSIELAPSDQSAASETVTVTPARAQAPTQAPTQAQDAAAATAPAASGITVTITEEAWLEVYRGSSRGEGAPLVYETAQPGDSFTFKAPVYIFSGNAGGVSVSQGDGAAEALGASGAVVGQAY